MQIDSLVRTTPSHPVLARDQVTDLTKLVLSMTSADTVAIYVTHTARAVTTIANSMVQSNDDGDDLEISIYSKFGQSASVSVETNQLTESALRAVVGQCEALASSQIQNNVPEPTSPQQPDAYPVVALWHDTTIQGMNDGREAAVSTVVDGVTKHGLEVAGFLGLMARSSAVRTKEGIFAFGEETDTELTVTARAADHSASGWAGAAARDWATIDYRTVAEQAAQIALRGRGAQAVEPGRRIAILSPAAVVQMARYFAQEFDAYMTDIGGTGFSKPGGGNKIGQQVFDRLIQMRSDPADPDGGYMNFFNMGFGNPKMQWVENGVLKNLAYNPEYATTRGKSYAENPYSLRIEAVPGTPLSTVEEMIAGCESGIYVNRLSDVGMIHMKTGLMTGVTNNGCFFIKDGKIDRPVKNFRILDSPFFFLNNIVRIGASVRATYGYTPPRRPESTYSKQFTWPRRPMIVPPLMVRDFNFGSLVDAV